ncbi:MAG: sugar ABC transporter permease, partial [Blautia sp.]|nr:sugar ABC transporter permease [Blautia sp.]
MSVKLKKELPWLGFIVPAFIAYTILTVIPLVQTLYLSFTNCDGYSLSGLSFVGLENFKMVLSDRSMKAALINTITYSLIFPVIT